MAAETRTWQELCIAASHEPDPAQLMTLVSKLMQALDERDQKLNPPRVMQSRLANTRH